MPPDFVQEVIDVFSKIKEEIDEKRGELDFRHSLANYLLKNVLGWGRKKGEGHYEIREREDIRLFDDHNRCVAIIETKNPRIARLTDAHRSELKEHLDDYKGMAQYGVLTNGHELKLFEYTGEGELNELTSIDIDAFAGKGAEALSKTERQKVHLLRRLRMDRFVAVGPEYFRKTAQTIKIEEPRNFDLFIEDLRGSLDELTRVIYERFFKFYWEAGPNHYGSKFLREEAFPRWKGASTGEEEELMEKFCRETAYVILNRILFTRILEDKGIVKRMISGEGIADLLKWGEGAYEMALKQAYKNVEKFYKHFYEFGIFDWWRLPEDKLGMLTEEEKRIQKEIEDEFNTLVIRDILKRLNQFDFRKVGRDILGDVYQEYLPPAERKQLGEFYTPVEVVRYILDAVGYASENRIEDKLLLDPACGSGTFLVEAAKRLAKRYEDKLKYPLQPDNAKIIIEGIVNNIHGLDINPFACHIAEMNLLFNIIDYLHAVHSKYRDYRLPRFNICCTDSLMPPGIEATIPAEHITNGRIRSHLEEAQRAGLVKEKQFDFVVGNPPYVRTHRIEAKETYQKIYKNLAFGQYDISYLFVGKGADWLKAGGKLGYITSNKFCVLESGIGLRKYLLETSQFKQFIDFSGIQTFASSLPSAAIVILEKIGASKGPILTDIKTQREVPQELQQADLNLLESALKHLLKNLNFYTVTQERFYKNEENLFDFSLPDKLVPLVKKVKAKSSKLIPDIVFDIRRGLRPDTSTFKDKFFISTKEFERLANQEKLLYKKHIRGENIIGKYKITWWGEHVKFDPEKMAEGGDKELHENPKIVIKEIGRRLRAAYDRDKYYCYKTIHIIREADSKVDLRYLVGVLNSTLIEFFFKSKFYLGRLGRGSFRFREQFLKYLPIKLPQTAKEKSSSNQIIHNVEHISNLNKQLGQLEEKIDKFPEPYLSGQKLKKLVNAAYDLSKLSKDTYTVRFPAIEPVKPKSDKSAYKLALTKDDYILFGSREMAEYVFEWLKKKERVRRSELLELKVPEEAAKVMDEFSSDKNRVDEIRKEVERLEGEIDELVYELYGLDAKDREVIEEFLRKF